MIDFHSCFLASFHFKSLNTINIKSKIGLNSKVKKNFGKTMIEFEHNQKQI